jgi:putative endonuclease
MTSKQLGTWGELYACEVLKRKGYSILEHSWHHSRHGEVDIIAAQDGTIVFVEVKTRRTVQKGRPLEAITRQKYYQIRKCAAAYLTMNSNACSGVRIDAVGILAQPSGIHFRHIKEVKMYF